MTAKTEAVESQSTPAAGGLAAEIITTGTEILLGEIVDSNAAWIAQQLREVGVNLYYKTTVGDNFGRISQVVSQAIQRSHVVIVSGGLGPTADDVTRHAIAAATERELSAHPDALEALKARFARLGAQMTENNLQQALIPTGATIIENPVGTAPGFIVETEVAGHTSAVIAVPGVPREMKHLMAETVLPYLRKRAGNVGIISRRVLRTIGIGESMIDDRLGELMHGNNPTVGLAAHTAQADVRITARGETAHKADAMLDSLEAEIRRRIGDHIYSLVPGQTIEEVVATEMTRRDATLAVVERHTHGAIALRLTAVAGGAAVAKSWSDEQLADAPQAVQEALARTTDGARGATHAEADNERRTQAALEAARGAAEAADVSIGLAVIGAAGTDNGVYGRDPGKTVVAVYGSVALNLPDGEISRTLLLTYAAADEFSVIRIGNQVLALLWNLLK